MHGGGVVHELSIATAICRSIAERVGNARVDEMTVQVGALSGVNRDSLEFCLGEAAPLCGVRLDRFDIELVPARAECACGHCYDARELLEPCPKCGGFSRSFTGGEEITINKLVVVEEDDQEN